MNAAVDWGLLRVVDDPSAHEPTDEQLALRRDASAFGDLYHRYVGSVYRFIAGRVAAREEAEDLTAEVFLCGWVSLGSFRGNGTFRAWLFGIARRALADHYRHRAPWTPVAAEDAAGLEAQAEGPEVTAERREQQRLGTALLASLTPEQQEILALRFVADLSYPEIAQIVGKREDAVKKIACRAMDELKRRVS